MPKDKSKQRLFPELHLQGRQLQAGTIQSTQKAAIPHNQRHTTGEVELKLHFSKDAPYAPIFTQFEHSHSMSQSAQISSIKPALHRTAGIDLRGVFPQVF